MIPRYNRPEIEKIWSNQNKFKIWTEIECLIAEQLANLGKIPKQASVDIRSNAKFNVQEIEEIEKKTKHDVIAYINNVSSYIGESSKYFHHGITSSDIIDTSFSLQLKQSSEIIIKKLSTLLKDLPITYQSPTMAPECSDAEKYKVVDNIKNKFKELFKKKTKKS